VGLAAVVLPVSGFTASPFSGFRVFCIAGKHGFGIYRFLPCGFSWLPASALRAVHAAVTPRTSLAERCASGRSLSIVVLRLWLTGVRGFPISGSLPVYTNGGARCKGIAGAETRLPVSPEVQARSLFRISGLRVSKVSCFHDFESWRSLRSRKSRPRQAHRQLSASVRTMGLAFG
jgi:hypothetical protein